MGLKWKRVFCFKKEKHYKDDGTYSIARDTTLVAAAHKLAYVYGVKILAFVSNPWTEECYFEIWGDKVSFNAFVADFCEEFETYIETVKY